MTSKKTSKNKEASDKGDKFTWEGANDTKLLLLTQGRWVKPEEYQQLSSAFPGASIGAIRNRISGLRIKQRDLYESLDWTLPSGAATHSAKKANGGKRKPDDDHDRTSAEPDTPTKKARTKRACKEREKKKQKERDMEMQMDNTHVPVKKEVDDEHEHEDGDGSGGENGGFAE